MARVAGRTPRAPVAAPGLLRIADAARAVALGGDETRVLWVNTPPTF